MKTTKPRGLERDLTRACMKAIALIPGCVPVRMNSGARPAEYKGKTRMVKMHEPGTPDILVLLPNAHCCHVELKRDAQSKLTLVQQMMHARLRDKGQWVDTFHSLNAVISWVEWCADQARAERGRAGER